MKDIKFTLYSCVYMGSGYTDWSDLSMCKKTFELLGIEIKEAS